jgi:pyruvate/2-oxoglutarate dehydrogenase complex dihydrolipoamide acyltransferase (E2) component
MHWRHNNYDTKVYIYLPPVAVAAGGFSNKSLTLKNNTMAKKATATEGTTIVTFIKPGAGHGFAYRKGDKATLLKSDVAKLLEEGIVTTGEVVTESTSKKVEVIRISQEAKDILDEAGIDPADVPGTGLNGDITVDDANEAVKNAEGKE